MLAAVTVTVIVLVVNPGADRVTVAVPVTFSSACR